MIPGSPIGGLLLSLTYALLGRPFGKPPATRTHRVKPENRICRITPSNRVVRIRP